MSPPGDTSGGELNRERIEVVIRRVDIPFDDMCGIAFKWMLAVVLVLLVFGVVGAVAFALFGRAFLALIGA